MAIKPPTAAAAATVVHHQAPQQTSQNVAHQNMQGPAPTARAGGIRATAPQAARPNAATPAYAGNAGQAGIDKAAALVRRRAKKKQEPFNFRLKQSETVDVVVLDGTLEDLHFDNEHELWVPDPETGKEKPVYEGCPKDIPNAGQCPLCVKMAKKPSYYNMKLTVLEIRPWTDKKGVKHEYGRRVMRVKAGSIPKFNLLREINGGGTFRGMQLRMTRDNSGKDAAIGDPVFVCMHSEQDILDFAGHDDRISERGVVFSKANEDCYPVSYKDLYPTPVVEELVAEYGSHSLAGSQAADSAILASVSRGGGEIPHENLGAAAGADEIPFDV